MDSIYKIIKKSEEKDTDGHALYLGECKKCGAIRVGRLHDLNKCTTCVHAFFVNDMIVYYPVWENKHIGIIFRSMLNRCYNPNDKSYRYYGKKHIHICKEWLNNPKIFEDWSLQNGYKDNLTIDRKNSKKDYSPENCRWISLNDNAKYKSTTNVYTIDGYTLTGNDWSKKLNLGRNTINYMFRSYPKNIVEEFIHRRLQNPSLKRKGNVSWFKVYNLQDMAH